VKGSWAQRPLAAHQGIAMGRPAANALYVIAMVGTIVVVDVLIFRHHFWARLAANVGIVLLFVAFYFRYFHRT
jgi:hypothetical protein